MGANLVATPTSRQLESRTSRLRANGPIATKTLKFKLSHKIHCTLITKDLGLCTIITSLTDSSRTRQITQPCAFEAPFRMRSR